MSKKATEFQIKKLRKAFQGTGLAKPLNTGWIDEHVASLREWIANIYFYKKGDQVLMIDAGYSYDTEENARNNRPPKAYEILQTGCSSSSPELCRYRNRCCNDYEEKRI